MQSARRFPPPWSVERHVTRAECVLSAGLLIPTTVADDRDLT
jgi:hypothetical protein